MFRAGIVGCVLLAGGRERRQEPPRRPNRRPSAAPISSTPSWPAAIAIRRATATAGRIAAKALSGGLTFNTPAFVATAPNITPDKETGIGSWSDAEIKRALSRGRPHVSAARRCAGCGAGNHRRQHHVASDRRHRRLDRRRNHPRHHARRRPRRAALKPPMAYGYYAAVKPADLADIVAYLRTVPPLSELSQNAQFQDRPGACKLIGTAVGRGDQTMTQRLADAAPC